MKWKYMYGWVSAMSDRVVWVTQFWWPWEKGYAEVKSMVPAVKNLTFSPFTDHDTVCKGQSQIPNSCAVEHGSCDLDQER